MTFRAGLLPVVTSALALTFAFAGCTATKPQVTPEATTTVSVSTSTATATEAETGPTDPEGSEAEEFAGRAADPATHPSCDTVAWIDFWRKEGSAVWQAKLHGEPTDTGAVTRAAGRAEADSSGALVAYTVAAGDAVSAIGARFCIDSVDLATLNHLANDAIKPGDRLLLRPDPSVPIDIDE